MILQQTLSAREKTFGLLAIFFLIGLVIFGYTQTVIQPAQASVLHTEKIEEEYFGHYQILTHQFDKIRENITLVKATQNDPDGFRNSVKNLELKVNTLEKDVREYEYIVEQALGELKRKNDATLGKSGAH